VRRGGGICIKFNFPQSINFSITRLKLKSTTLSDEPKLTMLITILKRRKYKAGGWKGSVVYEFSLPFVTLHL
jgi:hypothetical protein